MRDETKKFVLNCIEQHRGDDLVRAKMAFKDCTPEEMNQEHGESGQTRQQILDGYNKRNLQCDNAIAELEERQK